MKRRERRGKAGKREGFLIGLSYDFRELEGKKMARKKSKASTKKDASTWL
jgi:hypothetical protein